jgi:hypothetical protein
MAMLISQMGYKSQRSSGPQLSPTAKQEELVYANATQCLQQLRSVLDGLKREYAIAKVPKLPL